MDFDVLLINICGYNVWVCGFSFVIRIRFYWEVKIHLRVKIQCQETKLK